ADPDRAWRQGARSPHRVPPRHDAAAGLAAAIVVDRSRGAAAVVPAQESGSAVLRRPASGVPPAADAGISPLALCRADPRAGPPLRLRLGNKAASFGTLF